jgi:hypothetical protein
MSTEEEESRAWLEQLLAEHASDAVTPRSPGPGRRSALLAAATSPALRWAPLFDRLGALLDLPERALRELSVRAADSAEWELGVPVPGVALLHLQPGPKLAGADAGIVRVPAGTRFPVHRHLGEERSLVLAGSAWDSNGHVVGPGDGWVLPADSQHSFDVFDGADLIYAVVVFDGVEIDGQRFPNR